MVPSAPCSRCGNRSSSCSLPSRRFGTTIQLLIVLFSNLEIVGHRPIGLSRILPRIFGLVTDVIFGVQIVVNQCRHDILVVRLRSRLIGNGFRGRLFVVRSRRWFRLCFGGRLVVDRRSASFVFHVSSFFTTILCRQAYVESTLVRGVVHLRSEWRCGFGA